MFVHEHLLLVLNILGADFVAILFLFYFLICSVFLNIFFIYQNVSFAHVRVYKLIQIGTNNCTARYRTLSGGIGESPSLSPSPSSDYENDLAASHGLPMSNSKNKRNGAHINKGSSIITQKATVHHVSKIQAAYIIFSNSKVMERILL